MYSKGCYSPSYNVENQAMPGIEILDEEEDRERLAVSRANSRNGPTEVISVLWLWMFVPSIKLVLQAKEQQMIEMAKCGMTNDVTVTIFKILENLSLCWHLGRNFRSWRKNKRSALFMVGQLSPTETKIP